MELDALDSHTIRVNSRCAILNAAATLLSRSPASSLSEIASLAGVGRATLHRHFQSREELIRELALDALDATDDAVRKINDAATVLATLEQMFHALVPLGDRYHFLRQVSIDDPELRVRFGGQVEGLRALIEALRAEGALGRDVPTAWAMALMDSLIWTAWSAVNRGEVAARDSAGLAARSFFFGLGEIGAFGPRS